MTALRAMRQEAFSESLANHQIKECGIMNIGLPVVLLSSSNPYLTAGERGVLVIKELGTDLTIINAVFHILDGTRHILGPPVQCRNPVFVYAPIDHRTAQDK